MTFHAAGENIHVGKTCLLTQIGRQCSIVSEKWGQLDDFCKTVPRTLIHGSFEANNMKIVEFEGHRSIILFDWERAGWGVPALDLTTFLGSPVDPGRVVAERNQSSSVRSLARSV